MNTIGKDVVERSALEIIVVNRNMPMHISKDMWQYEDGATSSKEMMEQVFLAICR